MQSGSDIDDIWYFDPPRITEHIEAIAHEITPCVGEVPIKKARASIIGNNNKNILRPQNKSFNKKEKEYFFTVMLRIDGHNSSLFRIPRRRDIFLMNFINKAA
jgi:hypothetical protein